MSLIGQSVTIIGAGVAGLAAARALALRGAQVTVLEQADAIREVGAGLQISPNGACVSCARLGCRTRLKPPRCAVRPSTLIDGPDGEPVTRLDLAHLRPDQGYHFLHRADLIDAPPQGRNPGRSDPSASGPGSPWSICPGRIPLSPWRPAKGSKPRS